MVRDGVLNLSAKGVLTDGMKGEAGEMCRMQVPKGPTHVTAKERGLQPTDF